MYNIIILYIIVNCIIYYIYNLVKKIKEVKYNYDDKIRELDIYYCNKIMILKKMIDKLNIYYDFKVNDIENKIKDLEKYNKYQDLKFNYSLVSPNHHHNNIHLIPKLIIDDNNKNFILSYDKIKNNIYDNKNTDICKKITDELNNVYIPIMNKLNKIV